MIQHRDVIPLSISDEEELILASDCSGGIGMKEADGVTADPETVGYYCFRVAVMECLSVGAQLQAVQLLNFTSEDAWEEYTRGVKKGLMELGLDGIPITGSSESNMILHQSAIGITCIGKRKKLRHSFPTAADLAYALIGTPLVGDEVIMQHTSVAPLSLFMRCVHHSSVIDILPVGSKGVFRELSLLIEKPVRREDITSSLNLDKSGGPATSFIISYNKEDEIDVKKFAIPFFHPLHLPY
ncbi:ATP-binding protein (plasmid) [Cytobacillus spongiae]|uniref:ATP-binding protein n=1 Tax=Cytobacillus spongiae TaxID=2901381 RepID=UPI00145F0C87|nr:ATP-binding protein [Cytobacillus spongiae]MCA1062884.1 ATP-binding protein [Rossellomorea aquimaris]NMH70217.1 ATP-binding protein [Bacillus sp. RO3]UII58490.1 ATP-binding protein [Cytobacillus spongiae]